MNDRFSRLVRPLRFMRDFLPPLLSLAKTSAERKVEYNDLLADYFHSHGDRPALIGDEGSMTWSELDEFANRVAHWAVSLGLQRGHVVALLMENRPEFIAIWLGLSRIGVVSALLNTNLTGDRLGHCLREAKASHWIVGVERVDEAASIVSKLGTDLPIWIGGSSAIQGVDLVAIQSKLDGAASLDAALAEQSSEVVHECLRAVRRGKDGLFLIYTSGTTGLPKAAHLSHSKAISVGSMGWKFQKLDANDRVYCCLPLYHSAGGVMAVGAALFSGGSLVIARKFSAKRFWSDCAQHEVTSIQYIGELCRYLVNAPHHPDERAHRIRTAMGNGLRPEVWEPFRDRFGIGRIVEFYGATEGNLPLVNLEGRVGAVGQMPASVQSALGATVVRFDIEREEIIRDERGFCIRAESGEAGELLSRISSTARFEGYTDAAASEKKILRNVFVEGDTYFRSGDLLKIDEEGFFYFVDRIGDTFRWKGENVSTGEVAEVISVVEGVEEANVYGVQVENTDGRAGMAALVTNDSFDLSKFAACVEEELAVYARPVFVRLLPQMEITGTFKHRKVDLAKEGFDPSTIDDPIYYLDSKTSDYQILDAETCARIKDGKLRL